MTDIDTATDTKMLVARLRRLDCCAVSTVSTVSA